MNRNEIKELVKSLCAKQGYTFVDDVLVGKSVLILIRGQDCAKVFDEFLIEHSLEHTMPTLIVDGIGSYITIKNKSL